MPNLQKLAGVESTPLFISLYKLGIGSEWTPSSAGHFVFSVFI